MGYRLSILLLILVLACDVEPSRRSEVASTETVQRQLREELLEADRDFAAATQERGIDGWITHFAPRGAVIRGQGEVVGRDAVRELMEPAFADTTVWLVWQPKRAEIASGGDLGYTIGEYRVESTADGEVLSSGTYLTVWRRQPDGSWKVEADIGSPAP